MCRYHTARQPTGLWINPKMSRRLNQLFGSCWFPLVYVERIYSNAECISPHCSFRPSVHLASMQSACHVRIAVICPIELLCGWVYSPKPGCSALNNSVFKREALRDISHDNNKLAKSCIMVQHFLSLLTLQQDAIHVSGSAVTHNL